MAKGPIVPPEVEALIASVYQKHTKWKAPEIRNVVDSLLHDRDPNLPRNWPSLSKVQKVLAEVRKPKAQPQDEPWSTAMLDRYPELKIEPPTPKALVAVLAVWKSRIQKGDTFTIRAAKWAARLSAYSDDIDHLSHKADQYARTELMFELIGHPFNSMELDRSLMHLPVEISDFKSFLWLLAEQREDTERGIKDGVEQIRSIKKGRQRK